MPDLTAAPYPVTIGDQTFSMVRLSDRDYQELDNWYRSTMIDMARRAMPEDATQEERDEIMRAAMAEAYKLHCVEGLTGRAFKPTREFMMRLTRVLWQGLRVQHRSLTHSAFYELVKEHPADLEGLLDAFFMTNVGDAGVLKKAKEEAAEKKAASLRLHPLPEERSGTSG